MTKQKKLIAILLSIVIAISAFFITNTATSLDVTNDEWIMRGYVERDIIQHYTGWLFYRESHIGFPFGVSKLISPNEGATIAFSDSIPIMSLLFGLFSNSLPDTFQFFGIYTLLCYILMGIASTLLLSLFFKDIIPIVLSSTLFIFSPIMLERVFRHTALASHYIIVFSLYLYFKNRKEGFKLRYGYILLCFFAVAIHFYFVPMVLCILFADLIQGYIESKKVALNLLYLALNILTVIFTAFLFGYFYTKTTPSGVLGYGYFTMNLNSLINPVSKSGILWSYMLTPLGQGLGSVEGFNYLGMGILLAITFIIVLYIMFNDFKYIFIYMKSHTALTIVCVLLTLFAVSTTVVINNNTYLKIDLSPTLLRICSVFRSSGRMFWVVYYLIILFALVSLNRLLKKEYVPLLLSAIVIFQLVDIYPAIEAKRNFFIEPSEIFANPTSSSFFSENTKTYEEIFTISDNGLHLGLYFSNYAIVNDMKINEPFMARNNLVSYQKGIDDEYMKLMNKDIDITKLYIFDDTNRFFDTAVLLGDTVYSFQLSFEDGWYYILAPKNQDLTITSDSNIIMLKDIPLTIADCSDLVWTNGVLNEHKNIVTFYDNAFTRGFLEEASYIICEDQKIEILDKDYHDAGWVMITTSVEDASFLSGKPLQTE